MRILHGVMLAILLSASPAHSAWSTFQEYQDYIRSNPPPPPVIITYQDYLDAFPHGDNWVYTPDESLALVRQIVLEVLYTHRQLSPGDPDRLCILPGVYPPDQWMPGHWVDRLNHVIRLDTKAGHAPSPTDLFRDMILSMLKRSEYRCPKP